MEKISHIVRGNSRVASTDLKTSSAVRPGTPSFGRPVGESVAASEKVGTTASRAVALHNELEDKKAHHNDHIVDQMADQFFMNRIRRPDPAEDDSVKDVERGERGGDLSASMALHSEEELAPPAGYTPRGSFVDVQA